MKVGEIKKALVLAAGLGTRLKPLTDVCPKALIPLWGLPMLERTLRMLESWGVEEIAVNAHAHAEAVAAFVAARKGKAKLRLSLEPEILGTGGALRPLRDFFGNEPFWMVNADIACSLDPAPLVSAFESGDGLAAVWLEPKLGPRTVEVDRVGRVTCWKSPSPGILHTFTFTGLHLIGPRIFEFLAPEAFSTIISAYEAAMAKSVFVNGVVLKGSYWADAGTPERYLAIHGAVKKLAAVKKPGGELYDESFDRIPIGKPHFFCVNSGATVAAGVKGIDSVVLGGKVLPKAELEKCVIAGGTLGGRQSGEIFLGGCPAGLEPLVAALGWKAPDCAAAFLGARGSDRAFWRLAAGNASAIAIQYSDKVRLENARYAGHARLLASAGVPVPAILADVPTAFELAMEDWGGDSLEARMGGKAKAPAAALALYKPAVAALVKFHIAGLAAVEKAGTKLEPPFGAELYAWERKLFVENLLAKRYGFDSLPAKVEQELDGVAAKLAAAPQVLIHRDFQSSNILLRGKALAIIDFQGMRRGPAAYDLASLLLDAYVELDEATRLALAKEYTRLAPEHPEAEALLNEGAVQRLMQCLGAYGRLAGIGQTRFSRYLLPGLSHWLAAADACGLDALGALVEELIAREKYWQNGLHL